jgi:hypothetical protein
MNRRQRLPLRLARGRRVLDVLLLAIAVVAALALVLQYAPRPVTDPAIETLP